MRIDTWNAHRRRVSTRAGEVACELPDQSVLEARAG